MKIGIVEICEPNHYTAVEAIALTYATSLENQVTIFLAKEMAENYQFEQENIFIINKTNDESILDFLEKINHQNLDRIHINTVSKYYKEFAKIKWKTKIILTIHNIDIWLNNPIKMRWELLKEKISAKKSTNFNLKAGIYLPIKYFLKDIILQKYRDVIVQKLALHNSKILVYSDAQKEYLIQFAKGENIVVFPFCIHQKNEDISQNNLKLRICIPGSVDNHRRDYSGLFKLLEDQLLDLKDKICIDLLGYIPKTEKHLMTSILKLKNLGMEIIYNEKFIAKEEYQTRLNLCDIILGNLRVNLNIQSKYGETKETGVIFNMIKSAKPGIFPSAYLIPKNLQKICLTYTDNLGEIIRDLITNSTKLEQLKQEAKKAVIEYEPKNLYQTLINS